MKKLAFSLLELLVVIAIIATCAAILMPVATEAKKKAQMTGCASNLRQIYLALKLYQEDFGDYPNPEGAAFCETQYLGGRLRCPAADPRLSGPSTLFTYLATKNELPTKELSEKREECREKRGGDFPLAADTHHGQKAITLIDWKFQKVGWTALVARENGAVQVVREEWLMRCYLKGMDKPELLPCDARFYMPNL